MYVYRDGTPFSPTFPGTTPATISSSTSPATKQGFPEGSAAPSNPQKENGTIESRLRTNHLLLTSPLFVEFPTLDPSPFDNPSFEFGPLLDFLSLSDDYFIAQPSTVQSFDGDCIDPKLLMEPPKPPDRVLRPTMPSEPTFDPLAFPVPDLESGDAGVQEWRAALKRGLEENDEPSSVDSSNHQALSHLDEGGEQQEHAPNPAKKIKMLINFDTQTVTSLDSECTDGHEAVHGEPYACHWGKCRRGFDSGNLLATHLEEYHVRRGPYIKAKEKRQGDCYIVPQKCGWNTCDVKIKKRRYHLCSHVRSHVDNYRPPDDKGKCPYCDLSWPMSQTMRKHVKAEHPGGIEEMKAKKEENFAVKKEEKAARKESDAASKEKDALKNEEDVAKKMRGVAKTMRGTASKLRDDAKKRRVSADAFRGVAEEKRRSVSVERATARCASTPSKAPRPVNITPSLKPASKSSPDKSLRDQYKESFNNDKPRAKKSSVSRVLGFHQGPPATPIGQGGNALESTSEEGSSTSSESDDESDASSAAETKAPKSTVASRNPFPPGLRSNKSVSFPAPKAKYPTALLAACSALNNLISPQLKEEIVLDASAYTTQVRAANPDDKHGADLTNTIEAATQLLQQVAAVNTGRFNAVAELQNGVNEIAKKRQSQLEAMEQEVAALKQQMKK